MWQKKGNIVRFCWYFLMYLILNGFLVLKTRFFWIFSVRFYGYGLEKT